MTASHAYPDPPSTTIPFRAELARKFLHFSTVIIPLSLLFLEREEVLAVLLPLTALALLMEWLRVHIPAVGRFIHRYAGFMMRREECLWEHGRLCINGATWVLVGCTLTIALFPAPVALTALLIALIGDGAAALVGRRWGRHRIGRTDKSLEGLLAFLLAPLPLLLALQPLPPIIMGIGLLSGAAAEVAPLRLNDNLRIPLFSACCMWLTGLSGPLGIIGIASPLLLP